MVKLILVVNNMEKNNFQLNDSYKDDVESFTTCSVFCQMVGEHHYEPCNDKCHEMPYAYCIKECDDENKKKINNESIELSEEKTKNPEFDNCDKNCKHHLPGHISGPFLPHFVMDLSTQQTCMDLCEYNGNRPYESCTKKCEETRYARCISSCANEQEKEKDGKISFDKCDEECYIPPPPKEEPEKPIWPDPTKPKKTFPTDPIEDEGNDNDDTDPQFDRDVCIRICNYQDTLSPWKKHCDSFCEDTAYAKCMRKCGNSPGNFYECPNKCVEFVIDNVDSKQL